MDLLFWRLLDLTYHAVEAWAFYMPYPGDPWENLEIVRFQVAADPIYEGDHENWTLLGYYPYVYWLDWGRECWAIEPRDAWWNWSPDQPERVEEDLWL